MKIFNKRSFSSLLWLKRFKKDWILQMYFNLVLIFAKKSNNTIWAKLFENKDSLFSSNTTLVDISLILSYNRGKGQIIFLRNKNKLAHQLLCHKFVILSSMSIPCDVFIHELRSIAQWFASGVVRQLQFYDNIKRRIIWVKQLSNKKE